MRPAFENLEIAPDKAVAAEAATESRLKAADALIGLAVRPCIMRSRTSPECRPHRHFGAVALHNRAPRIIRVMRRTALRGVRTGHSAGSCQSGYRAGPKGRKAPRQATVRRLASSGDEGTLQPRGIEAGDREAARGQQDLGPPAPCHQYARPAPKIKVRVRILHE